MSAEIEAEVNKRFTMNLLIQGAASHTFLTTHHLVRDELNALDAELVELYDRVVLSVYIAQWIGDMVVLLGRPSKFWKRVAKPGQPFANHTLLTRHGKELADSSWKHAATRAKKKRVSTTPGLQMGQSLKLVFETFSKEEYIRAPLETLARRAVAEMWDIPIERLEAEITRTPAFGHIREPKTFGGRIMREGAAGWSCVVPHENSLQVVAKAWFWPLLTHELVKGTAELVCLHGLNNLDDDTYDSVMDEADHIEYEVWMMQAGAELYRRWLKAIPPGMKIAECLMHIAMQEPHVVEQIMLAVLEEPESATNMLRNLSS